MPTTSASDGTSLHYRVIGDGPRTVVFVHGWMVSGAVWNSLVERLDLTGLRLVIPDGRGTGQSGKPTSGYTLQGLAQDVLAVADAAGAKRFTLVGHSMGGQLAQWVAAQVPERVEALMLVNSVPASGIPFPPDAAALFRTSAGNRDKQLTIVTLCTNKLAPELAEEMLKDAANTCAPAIESNFDAFTAGGFADKLSAITAPTLVVGTDDAFLPHAFLRDAIVKPIRRARLAYLPGAFHYPQVERPAELAGMISAFLAGSAPA
ncbi:alpha/beta hydrolase [Pyxidicoccus fallax]|uniref:Alpha/beta hydrolase n=1 Tax=Pyxidicoccus fallax TaxID=394095 RepID=A0A848L8G2_9BACT|nr:alpha/beta hydrolase [Pyxidicoccus fallax]NMO15290.1 alpha/beta hydrolase [Pyxidicoccus fallax]NPC78432.1 alpha/beta hydrolase [Pyxidicoccus fallax]